MVKLVASVKSKLIALVADELSSFKTVAALGRFFNWRKYFNPDRSNSFSVAAAPTFRPFTASDNTSPLTPDGNWNRPVPAMAEKLRIVLS